MSEHMESTEDIQKTEHVAETPDVEPGDGRSASEPQASGADECAGAGPEILNEDMRQKLLQELDSLIERVRAATPDYTPPPFSAQRLLQMLSKNLDQFSPELRQGILERMRLELVQDFLDLDTWKGVWYMVNYSLDYQRDVLSRRVSGEYETDDWGLDPEVLDAVKPFMQFMYQSYWRVEVSGIENVPEQGRALLVSNHSGQLPWDGAMVAMSVLNEHPTQRLVRTLYATWFPTIPFVSALLSRCGQVLATEDNGTRLLENDELVAVFPEGIKGVGKLYKDRYRLARFGRGGFVRMALKSQAPIIPISVVGAEETYISLYKSEFIARLIKFPFFPISLTFPWLGLLGFVPFPTKWYIDFGEPVATDNYGPSAANNLMLVSQLTDQVRNIVQQMVFNRLAVRKSVFFG